MTKTKKIRVSSVTVYVIDLQRISDNLYTLSIKYEINEKPINTPILYYRLPNLNIAIVYFNKINNLIHNNLGSLCVYKMKNWLFNDHILKFLMRSQN